MRFSDIYYKSLPYRRRLRRWIDRGKPSENNPLKMLVVGAPRSGFALLIHILGILVSHKKWGRNTLRNCLQDFMVKNSSIFYAPVKKCLDEYFSAENIFVSGEFSSLMGGPKWLDKENRDVCCVRKYIGVKGVGDLTMVIFLPKYVIEFLEICNSHYSPALWINDSFYGDHKRFSSIRNPLDCITSAMFSLNALTSEYLQRYNITEHMPLREKLGASKLSDLNFFRSIMVHYLDYCKEFLEVRDEYRTIRWEDLIYSPEETIGNIARLAEIEIGNDVPKKVWSYIQFLDTWSKSGIVKLLDYVRPTFHKHNIWIGKKGHWKERLTNEHYEILIESGFNEILDALGYEKIEYKDEKEYTEFQKMLAEHLHRGEIIDQITDSDLKIFAFNKSNIRADISKVDFVSRESTGRVLIEKSTIKDDGFLSSLEKSADEALKPIWEELQALYERCR